MSLTSRAVQILKEPNLPKTKYNKSGSLLILVVIVCFSTINFLRGIRRSIRKRLHFFRKKFCDQRLLRERFELHD